MSYYVTLIHGTFAKDASWVDANSDFSKRLRENLGEETIIDKQLWTGKNSHYARIDAGEDISVKLEKVFAENPDKQHVVIAHSHGGNVILYSLRDMKNVDPSLRLVTLATPFIDTKKQEGGTSVSFLVFILTILVFLVSIFCCEKYFTSDGRATNLMLGLSIGGAIIAYHALKRFFIYSEKQSKIFCSKISLDNIPSIKILSIAVKGDEAYWWLKLMSRPSSVNHKTTTLTIDLWVFIRDRVIVKIFPYFVYIGAGIMGIMDVFKKDLSFILGPAISAFSDLIVWSAVGCFGLGIFLACLSIPLGFITRGNPAIYGWDSFFDLLSTDISPSIQLPSSFQSTFWFYEKDVRKAEGLYHSQPYISPQIIDDVCHWIKIA